MPLVRRSLSGDRSTRSQDSAKPDHIAQTVWRVYYRAVLAGESTGLACLRRGVPVAHEGTFAAIRTATEAAESNDVSDEHFIRDLNRLKELRSFLIQEAINFGPDEDTLSFGRLNLLQYKYGGRSPTQEEWSDVEQLTQILFRQLSEPLRRRFLLGEIPWWMAYLPIGLAIVALVALYTAVALHAGNILPYYLIWLMSLGAIGSVSFIGMNALSVQQDITFDLTKIRLMLLRITLGALFGLVLTLPFGYQGFRDFVTGLSGSTPSGGDSQKISQAMQLLFPFILGFSTSLVIMVLNRLVDAVQAFFGRPTGGAPSEQGVVASGGSSVPKATYNAAPPRLTK